jgi:hypothetical protein
VSVNLTTNRLLKEKTGMNGNYRRYMHLINAAATGLLQQIPVVGPMIQAVLAKMDNDALIAEVQRISSLLESGANLAAAGITAKQLEHDLIEIEGQNPRLASAFMMAEAEAGNCLAVKDAAGEVELDNPLTGQKLPRGRFLYLAANNYADAANTANIAANLGFLWRSYHAERGARIPLVSEIHVGDLIALAYRLPNQFRLLLPLVVIAAGDHTVPINDDQFPNCNHAPHAPFVLADPWLTEILVQESYPPDPVFERHSGLNVKVLPEQVPQELFPSPGRNAIWPYLQMRQGNATYYLPPKFRNWIEQL